MATVNEIKAALDYLLDKDSDPDNIPADFPFPYHFTGLIRLLKAADQYPLDTLGTNLDQVKTDIVKLRADVTAVQNEFGTLRTDVTQARSDINALRTDLTAAQNDVIAMQADVNQSQTDVSTLRTDVTKTQTDITTLQTEFAAIKVLFPKPRIGRITRPRLTPALDKTIPRGRR